jgi:homoserine O-acetyltransferase/O-succinyltransferase
MRLIRISAIFALASLALAQLARAEEGPLVGVQKMSFTAHDFRLENGAVLPELTIAYETYGRLALDGRNAVLVTHGFTSSQHAAGRYSPEDGQAGWWDGVIGPGKAIDTDRLFVVSSNMLGSSYGSTSPASLDPRTGKPYGPDFPEISLVDIVRAQRLLLDSLGVKHLVAVAGPSYGGFQTFQWGVTFPDFMDGLVPVVTAPKGQGDDSGVERLHTRLARDPNWHGGWYYDQGGIAATMTELRVETLKRYGYDEVLAQRFPDPAARAEHIHRLAQIWAKQFDANGMLALAKAAAHYNAEKDFSKIRAKLLYVLSSTDQVFSPKNGPGVMTKLEAAGVEARFFLLESAYGHTASGVEPQKWAPVLKEFLAPLMPPSG